MNKAVNTTFFIKFETQMLWLLKSGPRKVLWVIPPNEVFAISCVHSLVCVVKFPYPLAAHAKSERHVIHLSTMIQCSKYIGFSRGN